jgi:hypothetical protein
VSILLMLTSCKPFIWVAAGQPVSTETPAKSTATQPATASPTPTKPIVDLCTVRTRVPAGHLNLQTGIDHSIITVLRDWAAADTHCCPIAWEMDPGTNQPKHYRLDQFKLLHDWRIKHGKNNE